MSALTPLAAVLLDLDGTLLDTAPDMARALNLQRAAHGLAALPLPTVRPHVSHGAAAVVRAGFPDVDAATFDRLRTEFLEIYARDLAVETRLFAGFDRVLEALDAQRIPWGIITNKSTALTEALLRALALRERAACVLCGDSLPVRKPDPLPLLVAARSIGIVPRRCLYLGDALRDAQAARAAGMVALGARFGYIGAHDDITDWPVDAWIDSPLELLAWVGLHPAREAAHT